MDLKFSEVDDYAKAQPSVYTKSSKFAPTCRLKTLQDVIQNGQVKPGEYSVHFLSTQFAQQPQPQPSTPNKMRSIREYPLSESKKYYMDSQSFQSTISSTIDENLHHPARTTYDDYDEQVFALGVKPHPVTVSRSVSQENFKPEKSPRLTVATANEHSPLPSPRSPSTVNPEFVVRSRQKRSNSQLANQTPFVVPSSQQSNLSRSLEDDTRTHEISIPHAIDKASSQTASMRKAFDSVQTAPANNTSSSIMIMKIFNPVDLALAASPEASHISHPIPQGSNAAPSIMSVKNSQKMTSLHRRWMHLFPNRYVNFSAKDKSKDMPSQPMNYVEVLSTDADAAQQSFYWLSLLEPATLPLTTEFWPDTSKLYVTDNYFLLTFFSEINSAPIHTPL